MAPASTRTRSSRVHRAKPRFAEEAKALGSEIRKLREERKWSLYQAADASDVDLKHIQKIESGLGNVTLVTLLRLADGFDVPISRLFAASKKASTSVKSRAKTVAVTEYKPRFTKKKRSS